MFEAYAGRYCPPCFEKRNGQFSTVYNFIRDHPSTSFIDIVVRETGVPKKVIWDFIKEGRIELNAFCDGEKIAESLNTMKKKMAPPEPEPAEDQPRVFKKTRN